MHSHPETRVYLMGHVLQGFHSASHLSLLAGRRVFDDGPAEHAIGSLPTHHTPPREKFDLRILAGSLHHHLIETTVREDGEHVTSIALFIHVTAFAFDGNQIGFDAVSARRLTLDALKMSRRCTILTELANLVRNVASCSLHHGHAQSHTIHGPHKVSIFNFTSIAES